MHLDVESSFSNVTNASMQAVSIFAKLCEGCVR